VIELRQAIEALARHEVESIIVGEVAAYLHGYHHVTPVLELCYACHDVNLKRIVAVLAPFHPRPRGFPADLPFVWDEQTLRQGTNFTLSTNLGNIDLLGEVTGLGGYEQAREQSVEMNLFGMRCLVLSLDALITTKRAAGRTKDLLVLPELEALREVAEQNE
jgi:hypothetical protein